MYPSVDDQLAREVFAAAGVDRADGVEAVTGALLVDGDLLDPYLGPSAPVPPGHDVTRGDAWAAWIPSDVPGGRPDHLGLRGGGGIFRYRLLADRLERPDVAAFCEISTTHSGVGRRRNAHWVAGEQLWFVREDDDGSAELRAAEGPSPFEQRRRVVARGPYEELRARIGHAEDAA